MPISLHPAPWDDVDAAALRAAQRAELDSRYGRSDHEPGTAPSAADIDFFLVARVDDGAAAGCGGLRRLDETSAEIKRMYVRPENRGSGVSTAILRELEAEALRRGWSTLRLETGTEQPDAIRFYEREGYRSIDPFGSYIGSPISVCYERGLGAPGEPTGRAERTHIPRA
ncbi:GNAT family N-acetyltransferase [Herbiconiux sp. L3-i23]|uniref:GNAT family N-acetyltransferase n=1 Tax=Herbiconiux sp. L3-i23 TaxID=2905871 RepID=UPI00205F3053|nr:GNAT family N-acetyltransferase [Herbiconiux sp. L3-i23]BDI21959.1 N-acetyltransferase [Herbiconiux sp. L3-i23]